MTDTKIRRLLAPVVDLRERETSITLLMFSYSFLAMAGYNIIKPATRSKFIASLGAENMPYVMLAAGLLMGVIMHQYGRLVSRVPRRWIFPGTQGALVGFLLVFWALFKTGQPWVPAAFYFWGLLLGIFLISQFWLLANDIYDSRQAKRLFGFIGGGASLGGSAGAGLTAWLAQPLGTDNLLLVSAGCLALGTALSWHLTRRTETPGRSALAAGQEEQVGGKEALRLLRESRHLRLIALVIGFAAMGAVILEQQLNMATEAFVSGQDAMTGFLASITLYISLIAFFIQIWLTSRIHRLLGVGFALLVLPVSLAATSLLILLFPTVWVAAFARVQDSSLRYTLDKTSREILFVPLPSDLKHKAKPFVDVALDRFMGKGLGSILLLVLLKVLHFEWYQLSYVSLAMVGLWITMAVRAKREYVASFRRRLAQENLTTDEAALTVADLSAVELLVKELASPEERRVLYAIDLLALLDKRHFVTPLLLQHRSPTVRARALTAIVATRPKAGEEWLPVIESCLADEHPEVRAAALAAVVDIRGTTAADVMRAHLNDPDPYIVATAARALAESGQEEDVEASAQALAQMIDAGRDAVARGAAARAVGDSSEPRLRRLLVPLMFDRDEDVARAAIASATRRTETDVIFVPILTSLLGHRRLKHAARVTLASYGEGSLPALGHFLQDPDEALWTRRHLPATLALIPCQRSADLLLSVLDDTDGFVRYKAVAALATLHRQLPDLRLDPGAIETRAFEEAARATRYWRAYGDLFSESGQDSSMLAFTLRQKVRRGVGRIHDLLGLIYPWRDVASARWALEHGNAAAQTAAVEYLDNLLKVGVRRRLIPLIEDVALDRHADVRTDTVESVLAALLRDADPVVATAAVTEVTARHSWSLTPILEELAARDDAGQRHASTTAASALASRRLDAPASEAGSLSMIELAARLRTLALFSEVALSELLEIAALGRQVSFAPGDALLEAAATPDRVVLLVQGEVRLAGLDMDVHPPALFGLREVLEGSPTVARARAVVPCTGLVLEADAFLTLLSNNVELIQGLARALHESTPTGGNPAVLIRPTGSAWLRARSRGSVPLTPVEKAFLLREVPIFARATATELAEMVPIAREVALTSGSRLFSEYEPPSLYVIVSGELLLTPAGGGEAVTVEAGDIIGAYAPLASGPSGWRADVSLSGTALALTRDDLFELIADRVDLIQGIFSTLFQNERFRTTRFFSSPRDVDAQPGSGPSPSGSVVPHAS